MQIITSYNDIRNYGEEINFGDRLIVGTYDAGTIWEVLLCEACKNIMVRTAEHDDRSDEAPAFETIYPESGRGMEGLPKAIAAAYQDALRVRNTGNAYAVLLGRLLELVCIDQNASGQNLAEGLSNLGQRDILPTQLIEAANSIRFLRNIGAHASSGDIEDADVPILDSLTTAVLEYVYKGPQLISQAKKRIEQRNSKKTD